MPQHQPSMRSQHGNVISDSPGVGRTGADVDHGDALIGARCVYSPFTTAGFARMIERAGKVAKLAFKAHPHMLRHACGLRIGQQRTRYQGVAGVPRASQHSAHGSVY